MNKKLYGYMIILFLCLSLYASKNMYACENDIQNEKLFNLNRQIEALKSKRDADLAHIPPCYKKEVVLRLSIPDFFSASAYGIKEGLPFPTLAYDVLKESEECTAQAIYKENHDCITYTRGLIHITFSSKSKNYTCLRDGRDVTGLVVGEDIKKLMMLLAKSGSA